MAKNIAVIGDSESIKGFCAVGLDIFPCDSFDKLPHMFRKIADSGSYGIIFMTEEAYSLVERERGRYAEKPVPAVIPLPGVKGNTGTGMKRLSSFVEKAVGSDIIFNN